MLTELAELASRPDAGLVARAQAAARLVVGQSYTRSGSVGRSAGRAAQPPAAGWSRPTARMQTSSARTAEPSSEARAF